MDGIVFKYFNAVMVKLFGANWRTSLFALLAVAAEAPNVFIDNLSQFGLSPKVLHLVALILFFVGALNQKDRKVTGGTVTNDQKAGG